MPAAIALTAVVGYVVARLAIEPARDADVTTLIIITIGVSMVLRGGVEATLGKGAHTLAPFSGDRPIHLAGATLLPQSVWVVATTLAVVAALAWFFERTRIGKGMLATAYNRLAAELVGVDVRRVVSLSFVLSAAIGAIGGALIAPIANTSYDAGVMLGLKGFVAATLGGLGSGVGAVAGGIALGLMESLTAGYVSSAYKDAAAFVAVLVILVVRPRGMFGAATATPGLTLMTLPSDWGAAQPGAVASRAARRLRAGGRGAAARSAERLLRRRRDPGRHQRDRRDRAQLLIGYTGQISLGHAAFFGLGAYGSAILAARFDWPPVAALAASAAAIGVFA